ncbi:hypothetical protein AB5J72_41270 [Streptomyces sp. CG1]
MWGVRVRAEWSGGPREAGVRRLDARLTPAQVTGGIAVQAHERVEQ